MRGQQAEQLACEFLIQHGLQLIEKNYRCRHGEIDLVMKDGPQLVFVEVRYRRSLRFGGPLASIDYRKKTHLITCASHYLQSTRQQGAARFDVVGITEPNQIDWIQNALEAE
jgi:putative endonuclease